MKETKRKEAVKKKTYAAPKVMNVNLEPEEVMLGFCKGSPRSNINGRTHSLCQLCANNFGS